MFETLIQVFTQYPNETPMQCNHFKNLQSSYQVYMNVNNSALKFTHFLYIKLNASKQQFVYMRKVPLTVEPSKKRLIRKCKC